MRTATAMALLALFATACGQSPDGPSATPSPTETSPTASGSPSTAEATGPTREGTGPCPSRGEVMAVERARAVAMEPLTGEQWSSAPVATAVPAPFQTAGDYDNWFVVGTREDATILAGYGFMSGVILVEEGPTGSLAVIRNPVPGDVAPYTWWLPDGVSIDTDTCYETLALPATIDLIDDVSVTTAYALGAVLPDAYGDDMEMVTDLGGGTLVRVATFFGPDQLGGTSDLDPLPATAFAVTLPFGGWLNLAFDPLDGVAAIVPGNWVDYPDFACAANPVFEVRVPDTVAADWTIVGTLRGRDVAVPTASNPYALERFTAYAALKDSWSEPHASFDEYLALPGLVAVRADGGGWWAQIDPRHSPRAWC